MSIRILIADDSAVTRYGVAAALVGPEMEIVGEACDGEEAARCAVQLEPDVVLLEVRLPKRDGLWALKQIKQQLPTTRVIMYSVHDNPSYIAQAVALGACNYLCKNCRPSDLRNSVYDAIAGSQPNGASLMPPIVELMHRRLDGRADDLTLTKREHQVLRLVALGLSNRLIADCLQISIETVKEHVQNMLRKLGLRDRTEAAVFAVRKGIA